MTPPKNLVSVNERGRRIGETHPRARLTDHDIEMIFELRAAGWGYKRIAQKMEMSKRHVRDVLACRKRAQFAAAFRSELDRRKGGRGALDRRKGG